MKKGLAPTVVSSTDLPARVTPKPRRRPIAHARRAVADVGHLLRFRAASNQHRVATYAAFISLTVITIGAAVVPALVPEAGSSDAAFDVLIVLPTAMAALLLLAVVSQAASGGGRELLAREPATIHPISPTTDHLGALLLAPLNIAWLVQAWALLGATAFAVGTERLLTSQLVIVLWLASSTAIAQAMAWILEGVRRVPHGIAGIRALNVVIFGVALGLQISDRLLAVFDQIPTRWLVVGMIDGYTWRWAAAVAVVLAGLLLAVVIGAVPAHIAAHRVPRDELRVEAGSYAARKLPTTVRGALVRTDRASVWRAVPMRRGVMVLALGPGLVALLGNLQWGSMTILPGLVASGGALLYGINAWCLDSRGTLWRESLPVAPTAVFDARAYVLAEFLMIGSLVTVAVAALRAGVPSLPEFAALVSTLAVVTVQVVAAAMRWSAARPYAVDLRSSRATPAPPGVMVGYSARLAVSTTVTGLVFAGLSQADAWVLAPLFAVPMLAWSGTRLLRTRRGWDDAPTRAQIVTTVAVA
ncbi:MAG: hypothetical protein WB767_10535 [Nocardioides sp.]